METNKILISGAIIFKERGGKRRWFLIANDKDVDFEFPKVTVRKTESSVRAAIRMMAEQGGTRIKVLEEAGRAGGVATINGRAISQRFIYYLCLHKADSGENIGFQSSKWLEYTKAQKELKSKREKQILKQAKSILKVWESTRSKRKSSEDEEDMEEMA